MKNLYIVEFNLKKRSPITVENGDVIVDRGYSTVTVRNVEADSHEDAGNKARPKADAFLNELCWQHGITLEIGNSWTIAPQDSSETRHIRKLDTKLSIGGGHRRKVPRTLRQVVVKPSDAKSYYRKAQTSQDPFDEFRNLYLAIENVGSKIAAKSGEIRCSDSELIEIALRKCFASDIQPLENYGYLCKDVHEEDAIHKVATVLYKGHRCQLNHSKASEKKRIPYDTKDKWKVQGALPLAELVAKSLLSYEERYLLSFSFNSTLYIYRLKKT